MKHARTRVIFSKLYLDMRDMALVSNHDLTPGPGDLIETEEHSRTYYLRSNTLSGWQDDSRDTKGWNDSRPFPRGRACADDLTGAELLVRSLAGQVRVRLFGGPLRGPVTPLLGGAAASETSQALIIHECGRFPSGIAFGDLHLRF
ncbi:MAG: hypothetical protein ACRDS1_09525 [Pseudonocardiaceae bacterium]